VRFRRGKTQGAQVIAFHECSVTGYALQAIGSGTLTAIAEPIPGGESVAAFNHHCKDLDIAILAGLFEKTTDGPCTRPISVLITPGWWPGTATHYILLSIHILRGR